MRNYKINTPKLFTLLAVIGFTAVNSVQAQFRYREQALIVGQTGYGGTARSEAMGHSFGSIGGDATSLSINPAGLGVYNKSEFTTSFNVLSQNNNESEYAGEINSANKNNFSLDNMAYIFASPSYRGQNVKFNVGLGYNRLNDFYSEQFVQGTGYNGGGFNYSMSEAFAESANEYGTGDSAPFAPYAAYYNYLIDDGYQSIFIPQYADKDYGDITDHRRYTYTRGSHDEYAFSAAANVNNRLYIGLTLSSRDIYYSQEYRYEEEMYGDFVVDDSGTVDLFNYALFDYSQFVRISGSGFGAKFGIIAKPTKEIKLGVGFHTPVRFHLTEEYDAELYTEFPENLYDNGLGDDRNGAWYETTQPRNVYDYDLSTPWKFIFSGSAVVAKRAILSFDYEITDYSDMKLRSPNSNTQYGEFEFENRDIEDIYKNTHSIRTGGELFVNSSLFLRAGYQFMDNPYSDDSGLYDNITYNKTNIYSGGFGYVYKMMAIDVSYSYNENKSTEYLYQVFDNGSPVTVPVNVTDIHHKAKLTLGFRM